MNVENAQQKLWNGAAACAWIETQGLIDGLFKPLEERLCERAVQAAAKAVLDVGCGTGSTTLSLAHHLGTESSCVGIDISTPMIEVARQRATAQSAAIHFVSADAEAHNFESAYFDMVVSRFGVMFFRDSIRAFANLHRASRAGGALCVLTWRSAQENEFFTTAERAAAQLLPDLPERAPGGPGQFAFADPDRVRSILNASGWSDIEIQPMDVACSLSIAELTRYLTYLGPVGIALQKSDATTRTRVIEQLLAAFAPYLQHSTAHFSAACWEVTARASTSGCGGRSGD